MEYIEALQEYDGKKKSVFLAGGITGCPDWQAELAGLLKELDIVLLNPRRSDFPKGDSLEARKQIEWEHRQLRNAGAISFWFPKETLCPISLYELGAHSMTGKRLFIGVHPDYARRYDVEIQTSLARPDIEIVYSLEALADKIEEWAKSEVAKDGKSG